MKKKKINLLDCGSKTYKGLRPPRCNGGKGCVKCQTLYLANSNRLIFPSKDDIVYNI
jgi:hypothetical protein